MDANEFSDTAQEENRNGKIITFYSYKGGTGRSMILANVAWVMASSGKRVLTIDWDLEAPGLHRYFYPFLLDKDLNSSEGVINFFHIYKMRALTPPASGAATGENWHQEYADIRQYAVSLDWKFPQGGRLDFVPAGKQDETYSNLVNSFNWEDFYTRLGGNKYLEAVAAQMSKNYDYILIDSRTGVSDTSGICTVKLPDALVVCFTLNYQSINGASSVADYVYKARGPAALEQTQTPTETRSNRVENGKPLFNIFPLPMRLEDAQKRKMERRRDYARLKRFAPYPIYIHEGTREDYWARVPVQYDSYYAYEEVLAAFGEKERDITSLLASVERITAYLTNGEVTSLSVLPQPKREEILKEFEGDTYEPPATEPTTSKAAENAFASLGPEDQDMARKVILRLVRVAGPNESEHVRQVVNLNEFDRSEKPLIRTLGNFQLLNSYTDKNAGEEVVQIAQDVSLQDWKELQTWIDHDREFLLWLQRLRSQATEWKQRQRDESLLLGGAPLQVARDRLADRSKDLSSLEKEYINASIAFDERLMIEREKERQEQQRKLEAEQIAAANEKRKRYEQEQQSGWLKNLLERFNFSTPPAPEEPGESLNIVTARQVLRGTRLGPGEMLALAKRLKEEKAFSYARRVLASARARGGLDQDKDLKLKIYQQSALCTYKDTDLPADKRLDLALKILREVEDISTTRDQETLGLVGAIYKRKWEVDNQKQQLESSLMYYQRGYQEGPEKDQGYTGINAAFILDLLAYQEEEESRRANKDSDTARSRRAEARRIRESIVQRVAPLAGQSGTEWLAEMWWYYSTVAEAFFGLRRYGEAVQWLNRGRNAIGNIPEWEYEATIRQLVHLARLQSDTDYSSKEFENTEAWRALREFFGDDVAPLRSAFLGKIGLALSGGGFRASLFHIGVLARLADLDLLRHVEVLSCVSGGAIIGAHYYLEVRKLLQSKPDREITREDYIEMIARIKDSFLRGVQRNIRTRIAAEFLTNLWMIVLPDYSRTSRAGELYEREIFSRIDDGEGNKPRWLNQLSIAPLGETENFSPKSHNWKRAAKVPILILNATTLNTGHNWQFTTTWMGEPPAYIDSEIDGNDYLRRMYYWEAPKRHRQIRLGQAVAASACVPGIFEPLVLKDLYPDRVVRLVDGGVCDNQGAFGLLEQDCTVMMISDASGQMSSQEDPASGVIGPLKRSNTILQSRVREAQHGELLARWRSSLLRGFMFVHLKEDLSVDPVDWVDCRDPHNALEDDAFPAARKGILTRYGIAKELQESLAKVRTDLDSFSDVESYSLMTSAYRMTDYAFKQSESLKNFPGQAGNEMWDFLKIERSMVGIGAGYSRVKKLLGLSSSLAFKVWKGSPIVTAVAIVFLLSMIAFALWGYMNISLVRSIINWSGVVLAITALLTTIFTIVSKVIVGGMRWRAILSPIVLGTLMISIGWILMRLHLLIFDKIFLRRGSMQKIERQTD